MTDKKRGRPKKDNTQLNSTVILKSAKQLLLAENKIPSIRKIALELNIDPMSIYHYYPNKNSLLESITVSLMQEIYEPKKSDDWKKELELLCKSYLSLLSNYSGLLEIMLKMKSSGPAVEFTSRLQIVLSVLELNKIHFNSSLCLLVDYLHGVAFAIQCNDDKQLTNNEIDEPLKLIICVIESCKNEF